VAKEKNPEQTREKIKEYDPVTLFESREGRTTEFQKE
jgi:hypothetical protein